MASLLLRRSSSSRVTSFLSAFTGRCFATGGGGKDTPDSMPTLFSPRFAKAPGEEDNKGKIIDDTVPEGFTFINFYKYSSMGQDFLIVDNRGFNNLMITPEIASLMCNSEGGGIGAKAVYFLTSGRLRSFGYKVLSADIDVPEIACDMGLMCVSRFISHRENVDSFSLACGDYEVEVQVLKNGSVKVDMGILDPATIRSELKAGGVTWNYVHIFLREPYCITFTGKSSQGFDVLVDNLELKEIAREFELEFDPKTNIVFGQVLSKSQLQICMWHNDIGKFYSGEAACALVIAAILEGRVDGNSCVVHFPSGGSVNIERSAHNKHVYMTGPAEFVFQGSWPLQ